MPIYYAHVMLGWMAGVATVVATLWWTGATCH
jgi:hypothetical protein